MKAKIMTIILLSVIFIGLVGCSQNSQEPTVKTYYAITPTSESAHTLESELQRFMTEKNVTLTAKEVQYNMANNVGKEFGLGGVAKICDYYNWGYDESIEPYAFCINVFPSEEYWESWYIYFDRENASKLYEDLLEGDVYVFVIAKIEKNLFEKNQENMATGISARWFRLD